MSNLRANIDDFLLQKRIAFVGVSRNPRDFSRSLYNEFRKHGYDVVPVNPNVAEIEGAPCYGRIQEVQPAPQAVVVLTSRDAAYRVLVDCEEAGIKRVWLYGTSGPKGTSAGAVEFCAAHGIELVPGYCPYMFFPQPQFVHRCHRGVMKLLGSYPN
jgi:predicted CoA-binding protein